MIKNEIEELLLPLLSDLGYELWGCEYLIQGKYSLLRIYIDKEEGIGISDCELVSKKIAALLDVEDPIPGNYSLEVSSPGIPRPLFHKEQYLQYIGKEVLLKLSTPIEKSKKISGIIKAVGPEILQLSKGEIIQEVPFSQIVKANLIGE